MIVHGASIVTPNLSSCNFAIDVLQSLTSRFEIAFDVIIDESYLFVKKLIEFSVLGCEVRLTDDVVPKCKIDN